MQNKKIEKSLLSVSEVAAFLDCDVVTVRRKIREKQLAAFRLNGGNGPYRISGASLDAFMARNTSMVEAR